jgi:hypothetical protein
VEGVNEMKVKTSIVFFLLLILVPISFVSAKDSVYIPTGKTVYIDVGKPLEVNDKVGLRYSSTGTYNNGRVILGGIQLPNYPTRENVEFTTGYSVKADDLKGGFQNSRNYVSLRGFSSISNITLYSVTLNGEEISLTDVVTEFPPEDVTNFQVRSASKNALTLSWDVSQSEKFYSYTIYKNGEKLSTYTDINKDSVALSYVIGDIFTLKVTEKGGLESKGVSVTAKYDPPLRNVDELNAKPDYNRVDLSWSLPESTKFKHVNIYRDTVPEEKGFFQKMFSSISVSAADGPTKIFETNGTYFNDLTVNPETTYEYKLTSVGTDGTETNGATVQATTLEEPTPVIKDPGYEVTPEGDYLYTWTSPEKGKVKVLISGNEYQTVDAADKKILIPKDKMKYKMMGEPDISLQPISEYGKEGEIHEESPFEEGMLPFEGGDLLKTSMSLLVVLGPFILLALAFLIYPKLKQLIVKALEKRNGRRKM